jgi:hypothetical protein
MPSYNLSTRQRIVDIHVGLRVEATTNPIVTGSNAVFTIAGGRILLCDLLGQVTADLQAAATLLHWDAAPTFGGAAALSVDSADLTGDLIGTEYLMPAAAGGAMTVPAGGAYLRLFPALGWVITPGTLNLHASASRTGGIKWVLFYLPLDEGAYVQAA